MKKPWTMKAAGRGALTIQLFEQIGDDFYGEGITAKSFGEDLADAGPGITDIALQISSPGGNCFDGLAIFDLLLRHPADVTAEVFFAASIASVIAMAARKITISPTGQFMIHNPSTMMGGDAAEFRKMADVLDRMRNSMVLAYRRHTKKTKAEIEAMMQSETWMDARESVAGGFAEEISDPDKDDEPADLAAILHAPIVAKFRHMPAQIAARLQTRCLVERQPLASDRERQRLQLEVLRRLP